MAIMKARFDKFIFGFLLGLIGVVTGFFGFGMFWNMANGTDMNYFINEVFLGTDFYQSKIITVSILLDVLLFYIFMRFDWQNLCKGIMGVIVLAVIAVIYFW